MPRYFFHTADRGHIIDGEGHELPDLVAAQRTAIRLAGDILRHESVEIFKHDFSLQVTNQHGLVLFSIAVFGLLGTATVGSNDFDPSSGPTSFSAFSPG